MILTVTANPALDVTYRVTAFAIGEVNRVATAASRAGGKGFNVARVLAALRRTRVPGTDVLALGPAGGPDGEILAADLAAAGIPHELVPIQGRTRRTVNVVDAAGATMLNEPGPVVTAAEWVALRERVAHWLPRASVLVLSGSLPPGVPADAYATLVADARRHAVPAVVDADGRTLTDALASGPAVIKPNAGELAGVAGPGLRAGAARLREHGAQAVVASDGPNGLYADTAQGRWTAEPPRVHGGNPTGAGDAAVAALAMGLALGWDWPRTLTHAAAMSAAAVPAELAGEIDLAAYHHNLERVVVRGDAGESRS